MTNIRSFDLNLLRALDALLSEGQVSAAARALNLSQPATSAALSRLREALDDPLMVRNGRAMVLTRLALDLRPRVHRLMEEIEETLNPARQFDPARSERRFRIAANDYAAFAVLAPLIAGLRGGAPGVTVEILPLEGDFARHLSQGDHDLAIRDAWSLQAARNSETLFHEDYVAIARRDHPRLSATPTLDEFLVEGHVLIAPKAGTSGPVDTALARLGRVRQIAVTVPHFLAAPAIVAETDLVMTIARRVARRFAGEYGLRLFTPPLALTGFSVAMAWPAGTEGDPAVEWLKDQVRGLPFS
ncbi:MAG: LysR family transcriptional regulator [Rhizobiaceae bacterium]|nr:LysR family transcriptional regulator [Rhizobiaceae bacterium]MCV0405689.1 LysR family transcriptional regulator [Rhizobiaceae bacterium]